jgi:hypothetical protein
MDDETSSCATQGQIATGRDGALRTRVKTCITLAERGLARRVTLQRVRGHPEHSQMARRRCTRLYTRLDNRSPTLLTLSSN